MYCDDCANKSICKYAEGVSAEIEECTKKMESIASDTPETISVKFSLKCNVGRKQVYKGDVCGDCKNWEKQIMTRHDGVTYTTNPSMCKLGRGGERGVLAKRRACAYFAPTESN